MCLLSLCRFSELVGAILGEITLFNGRCDVLLAVCHVLNFDMTSNRPLNRKSPKTASRSSEKREKHSKHITSKVFQTLFRFLGILHGKLPIYILGRIVNNSHITLWLTEDEASALS